MADEGDIANYLVEAEISRALDKLRQNAGKATVGAKECFECGDAIPQVRRKMGFKLCVSCAEDGERKKQLFAG
jgi:RNA polymerase-binding transcription factor DksA